MMGANINRFSDCEHGKVYRLHAVIGQISSPYSLYRIMGYALPMIDRDVFPNDFVTDASIIGYADYFRTSLSVAELLIHDAQKETQPVSIPSEFYRQVL